MDLYSIKPVDRQTIIKCAKETESLISIEDHNTLCGIGSIVSNVLTEEYPKKLIKLGVKDMFGKSGKAKELYDMYGINVKSIIDRI